MTTALLVLAGGAIGAPLRYVTDLVVKRRYGQRLPWATLTVNVVGSLLLGVLLGLSAAGLLPDWVTTLAGVGFCGALTTFSTFSFETLRLFEGGAPVEAALNVVVNLVAGLGTATGAYYAVSSLL